MNGFENYNIFVPTNHKYIAQYCYRKRSKIIIMGTMNIVKSNINIYT
jgi:hypothetical protein